MSWTAIIPVRLGGPRKSRLAQSLQPAGRERLADALFAHVLAIVRHHPKITETFILSLEQPALHAERWWPDEGRGINEELTAVRAALPLSDLLVVNADLPFLSTGDLTAMIDAAEIAGAALAPDHTGEGTNAMAISTGWPFTFAFGPGSLAIHCGAAGDAARLVRTVGLARDIDTPVDLAFALAAGFRFESEEDLVGSARPAN